MRPRIVRSPVDICFGTKPSQAAKSRPLVKAAPLAMATTIALAMSGPMPGTVIHCRQLSLSRASTSISSVPRRQHPASFWTCRTARRADGCHRSREHRRHIQSCEEAQVVYSVYIERIGHCNDELIVVLPQWNQVMAQGKFAGDNCQGRGDPVVLEPGRQSGNPAASRAPEGG